MENEDLEAPVKPEGNASGWMRKSLIALLCVNALVLLGLSADIGRDFFPFVLVLVLLSGSAAVPFVTETGSVALGVAPAFVLLYGGLLALVGGVVGACSGVSFGASGGGGSMPLFAIAGVVLGVLMALLAILAPSRMDDPTKDDCGEESKDDEV